eukprot:5425686-Amphidinium_carterae.1
MRVGTVVLYCSSLLWKKLCGICKHQACEKLRLQLQEHAQASIEQVTASAFTVGAFTVESQLITLAATYGTNPVLDNSQLPEGFEVFSARTNAKDLASLKEYHAVRSSSFLRARCVGNIALSGTFCYDVQPLQT